MEFDDSQRADNGITDNKRADKGRCDNGATDKGRPDNERFDKGKLDNKRAELRFTNIIIIIIFNSFSEKSYSGLKG